MIESGSIVVASLKIESIGRDCWRIFEETLDSDERAQAEKFLFEADRRAYIAAHALLRLTLSNCEALAPATWRFGRSEYGRPFLLSRPEEDDLRFSLSHARERVAVAVARGLDVGVDVDSHRARPSLDVSAVQRYFADDEVEFLRSASSQADRLDRLLMLWTLKEAVVKATGAGLSQPLDGFSIRFDPLRIVIRNLLGEHAESPVAWSLAHWRYGDHHLAVAARGDSKITHLEHDDGAFHRWVAQKV